jgi:hypothetical protein
VRLFSEKVKPKSFDFALKSFADKAITLKIIDITLEMPGEYLRGKRIGATEAAPPQSAMPPSSLRLSLS